MFERYRPKISVKCFEDISASFLNEKNIKCVLLDIDNTMVSTKTPLPDKKVCRWVDDLKKSGIVCAVISNATEKRAKKFCEVLGIQYVYRAYKPRTKKVCEKLKELNIPPENTAFFGDQLFTDMRCANRLGMLSVLVSPIDKKEIPYVRFKRIFEKVIKKTWVLKED